MKFISIFIIIMSLVACSNSLSISSNKDDCSYYFEDTTPFKYLASKLELEIKDLGSKNKVEKNILLNRIKLIKTLEDSKDIKVVKIALEIEYDIAIKNAISRLYGEEQVYFSSSENVISNSESVHNAGMTIFSLKSMKKCALKSI